MMRVVRVILTDELLAEGLSYDEVARRTRAGELVRLRRGAYIPYGIQEPADADRRLIEATLYQLSFRACVSHQSAALLHGLPVPVREPGVVTVTWTRRYGGRIDRHVHLRVAPLQAAEIVDIDGIRTTSMARTVVDVARSQPFGDGVVVADAALRSGLTAADLMAAVDEGGHRPGGRRARRVAAFADAASENGGESRSRITLALAGLPKPELQQEIYDPSGRFIARVDFLWRRQRTVGEFDGDVKYSGGLGGIPPHEVVINEKRREDELRDLGWQVVRWVWRDLERPALIAARITRAFARASSAPH
jgi:hypothetical protein